MTLYYFILGALLAIAGALPLGTVNLAVVNTAMRENTKKALHVVAAAGIGEVLLATSVLYGSMEIASFLEKNLWIHTSIIFIFLGLGLYLLTTKKANKTTFSLQGKGKTFSKYTTGFLLAIMNPPVLIYWLAATALSNTYLVELNLNTPLSLLALFFCGIYLGKTFTLYLYSLWGAKIAQRRNHSDQKTSKLIGIIFVVLAVLQALRQWVL